jgi:lysozyme family protein
MAASSYDAALARLLAHEGGYSNHPSDPGGPTNFGITIYDYRKYVKSDATAADVRAMKVGDAKAIYRTKYWDALRCNDLSAGLDYAIFDYGVNSGIARAAKVLRRICGIADGDRITDAALTLITKRDAADLITRLCDERLAFLQSLRTWPVFGVGWGRRVAEVKAAALAMATSSAVALPTKQAQGRGVVPLPSGAQKGVTGGVVAAGAATAHQAAQSGASVPTLVFLITAALLVASLAWFAFHWWQKRKQEAPVSA